MHLKVDTKFITPTTKDRAHLHAGAHGTQLEKSNELKDLQACDYVAT